MSRYDSVLKLATLFADATKRNEYFREYMANRYRTKRDQAIKELGGKCSRCGSKKNLHIDHKNRKNKEIRMSDIHSVSDSKVKKELKKVQLLCSDCHKEKSRESWDFSTPKPRHGTYWMYRRHNCRCARCMKAYKEKMKEYRANHKEKSEKAG